MSNWFENIIRKHYKEKFNRINNLSDNYTVLNFDIYQDTISAQVSTFINLHSVYITFKPFTNSEKTKLNKLTQNQDVILSILKNEFPSQLSDCGIKIYPDSMDDFYIECGCGDNSGYCGEVICVFKHLLDLMEKNPLLIFSLKGFDLKNTIQYPVKSIKDIFSHNFKENNNSNLKDLYGINCFLLDNYSDKEDLVFIYRRLFKTLVNFIEDFSNSPSYRNFINLNHFKEYALNYKLFYKKWGDIENISFDIDSNYKMSNSGRITDEMRLFSFLMELVQIDYKDSNTVKFLIEILKLTLKLVENTAIIPELIKLSHEKITVRWIPAFFDSAILKLCKSYYSMCPDNFITFNGGEISKENQVIILISLIMKGFINYILKNNPNNKLNSIMNGFAFELMFNKPVKFNTPSRMKTIRYISRNLSPFHMRELPFTYVFLVHNYEDILELELKILENGVYKTLDEVTYDKLLYVEFIYNIFSSFDIENQLYKNIILNKKRFLKFKNSIQPIFNYLNVEVESSFDVSQANLKLKLDIGLEHEDYFTLKDFNNFQWKVAIDDEEVSIDEFNEICSKDLNSLIKLNDKYYFIDRKKAEAIKNDLVFLPNDFESFELLQISLLERYKNLKIDVDEKFKNLLNFSNITHSPHQLNGELRQYQQVGFSWLIQNIKSGFGSILADDMGL